MALIIFILTLTLMMVSLIYIPKIYIFKRYVQTHWLIVLTGALFMIIFGFIPIDHLIALMTDPLGMNPIKLITLFIFLTIISLFLDEVGFFKWLAYVFINRVKGKQWMLFLSLYVLTSILTIFTSNDIIILTLTPLIIYFSINVKINPLPYLFGILTASNTWSLMLMIGNPTNIYLASKVGIDFMEYFKVMWLPALTAGTLGFILISVIFRKDLNQTLNPIEGSVQLKEPVLVGIGLIHLLSTIVLMALSNYIQIEMWVITVLFGMSIIGIGLIYLKVKKLPLTPIIKTVQRAPWDFIPMILGMFILISAISYSGYVDDFANYLNMLDPVYGYGISSHIVSNLTNNQPMSMLYAEILISNLNDPNIYVRTYASIIGSNTGVLLTPFGALAGLMWHQLLRKYDISLSVLKYIQTIAVIGFIILIGSLFVLSLVI